MRGTEKEETRIDDILWYLMKLYSGGNYKKSQGGWAIPASLILFMDYSANTGLFGCIVILRPYDHLFTPGSDHPELQHF